MEKNNIPFILGMIPLILIILFSIYILLRNNLTNKYHKYNQQHNHKKMITPTTSNIAVHKYLIDNEAVHIINNDQTKLILGKNKNHQYRLINIDLAKTNFYQCDEQHAYLIVKTQVTRYYTKKYVKPLALLDNTTTIMNDYTEQYNEFEIYCNL